MSSKSKPLVGLVVFVAVVVCLLAMMDVFRPLQLELDAHCLKRFAHRISNSDRVVASMWTDSGPRKQFEVSVRGEDAKRVIRAVTSADCARPPTGLAWANMYLITARFFKDTNVLGQILVDDGELFRVGSREYRDITRKPGTSSGGVLRDLLCAPVQKLVLEAEERKRGLR